MPYYQDNWVTLYQGNAMQLLPMMPSADAVITDPPYGETSLEWDCWPEGWPGLALRVSSQLWWRVTDPAGSATPAVTT
ncbi:MAG: hypothetical protein LPD71_07020 [Shewanella sp.]|nr:hypothetical protein [Shewanella sp.]